MTARDAAGAVVPTAPSGVTAEQLTDTSITITWTDNSNNEDNFNLYESVNGGAFSKVATPSPGSEEAERTGLTTGNTYDYEVSAENEVGESARAGPAGVTLESDAPDAPTNLQASAASSSQVDLTWNDNATNEDEYRIYRDGSLIDTIAADSVAYSATGLDEATSYDWQVAAANVSAETKSSTVTQATQLANPSSVTKQDIGGGRIRIEWVDNSSETQNIEIFKNGALVDTVSPSITRYDATGVISDTFEVRAIHSTLPDSDKVTTSQI